MARSPTWPSVYSEASPARLPQADHCIQHGHRTRMLLAACASVGAAHLEALILVQVCLRHSAVGPLRRLRRDRGRCGLPLQPCGAASFPWCPHPCSAGDLSTYLSSEGHQLEPHRKRQQLRIQCQEDRVSYKQLGLLVSGMHREPQISEEKAWHTCQVPHWNLSVHLSTHA